MTLRRWDKVLSRPVAVRPRIFSKDELFVSAEIDRLWLSIRTQCSTVTC